jgi:hypothetical protein
MRPAALPGPQLPDPKEAQPMSEYRVNYRVPFTPTVHLNGTGREGLLYQATGAAAAVQRAQHALLDAWPHGRDYYPQGPEALAAAEAQFKVWQTQLAEVYRGLSQFAERISEAGRVSQFHAGCTCGWRSPNWDDLSDATDDANTHAEAARSQDDGRTHRIVVDRT